MACDELFWCASVSQKKAAERLMEEDEQTDPCRRRWRGCRRCYAHLITDVAVEVDGPHVDSLVPQDALFLRKPDRRDLSRRQSAIPRDGPVARHQDIKECWLVWRSVLASSS